ncbi:MAG: hypothetical protein ACXVCP_10575 [Bdellovibrio sp.]
MEGNQMVPVHFSIVMTLLGMLAIQANAISIKQQNEISGEVRWGETYSKKLDDGITIEVELLGKADQSQDGIYVSALNKKNPPEHQFVIVPYLVNGNEINFIGVNNLSPHKPLEVSKSLHSFLLKLSGKGTEMMYFTDVLNPEDEAALNTPDHFQPVEVYAKKNAVIKRLHKVKLVFKILSFTLSDESDPKTPAHIQNLKFSINTGRVP